MQFPVEVKIEPSKTGKTFGIAIVKNEKVLLAIKGCKLANGTNGQFVSGPSSKMDDGTWMNYLFINKEFNEYLTKLAIEAVPQPPPPPAKPARAAVVDDVDVPF